MNESKSLRFEETTPKAKTKVWNVVAKQNGLVLGVISFFGRWRKYVFAPNEQLSGLVFDDGCLHDIAAFTAEQNRLIRSEWQVRRRAGVS